MQRVMIAMAIACDPALLIADEPTTALDVTVQATILDLLRDLRDRRGMSMMFITHDLGLIAEIARRCCCDVSGQNRRSRTRFADLLESAASLYQRLIDLPTQTRSPPASSAHRLGLYAGQHVPIG